MDDHNLTIDDSLPRYSESTGDPGEAFGPVETIARVKTFLRPLFR
jgi:hypothetical protein